MPYSVYILRLENNRPDVGSTSDLRRRLTEHHSGSGSKTTAQSSPLEPLYSEPCPNHWSALRRERQLKRWSQSKKLALISGDLAKLKKLARSRSAALLCEGASIHQNVVEQPRVRDFIKTTLAVAFQHPHWCTG